MPFIRNSSIAAAALFLSACSMTLPVQGVVDGGKETMTGTATGYTNGAGTLEIKTSKGTTCKGNFVYVTPRQGSGVFNCDDGRSGPFQFVSTGSQGTGTGTFGGQSFTFTFG
ncbi:MAG: hypothetical protein QM780_15725 [Hyphomicrobium sp.]|uniref:hypothetical protein n=1 Tax=Hyphomicrobium sp. TaxID=82 RepID=UPI0039E41BBF